MFANGIWVMVNLSCLSDQKAVLKLAPTFFKKACSTSHIKDNVGIPINDVKPFSPLVRKQPCQLGVFTCLPTDCHWKGDVKLQGKWKCILQAKLPPSLAWRQYPNRLTGIRSHLKEVYSSCYLWPCLEEYLPQTSFPTTNLILPAFVSWRMTNFLFIASGAVDCWIPTLKRINRNSQLFP